MKNAFVGTCFLLSLLLCGCAVQPGGKLSGPDSSSKATILVGQSWLGVWQGSGLVAQVSADGWQFNSAHLTPDGKTVEVAAFPTNPDAPDFQIASILHFDSHTLKMTGKQHSAEAARWPPLAAPVSTNIEPRPINTGPLELQPGETLVAASEAVIATQHVQAGGLTSLQLHLASGKLLGPPRPLSATDWRIAFAPDGSTAAVFGRNVGSANAPWQGEAWDTVTGNAVKASNLTIDDGSEREDGSARELACLLPSGSGAIYTYIGAPADRRSEFQSFTTGAAAPVPLDIPYVMTCLGKVDEKISAR